MISATDKVRISALLPQLLMRSVESEAKHKSTTKSAILEEALELWLEKKLESEAKMLSKIKVPDLPTEDEWNQIQSETLKDFPW